MHRCHHLQVYGYDEGFCFFRGVGHSGSITKVAISPDQQFVVSAGSEGAIFLWKVSLLLVDVIGCLQGC